MAAACHTHGPLGDCPFLEALEAEDGGVIELKSRRNGGRE